MDWGDRSPLRHLTIKGQATTGEYYLYDSLACQGFWPVGRLRLGGPS